MFILFILPIILVSSIMFIKTEISTKFYTSKITKFTNEITKFIITEDSFLTNKLKIIIDQPCNYCSLDESVECEDDGYLAVYTRVKVNVEDYLNQDLRNKMDTLLEKPEEMMNEIKEF